VPQKRSLKGPFDQCNQHELAGLVDELTPRLSQGQASRLLRILVAAQTDPPTDKREFVNQINRVFDLYRVCIATGDDDIYRLKYLPGGSGKGHIYLLNGHGRNVNTFLSSALRLVDVAPHYLGNKRAPDVSGRQCPVLASHS